MTVMKIPLIIYLFSANDTVLNTLADFVCLFVIFIFIIQFQSNRIIDRFLSIRLDNRNLIDRHDTEQKKIDSLREGDNEKSSKIKKLQTKLKDMEPSTGQRRRRTLRLTWLLFHR